MELATEDARTKMAMECVCVCGGGGEVGVGGEGGYSYGRLSRTDSMESEKLQQKPPKK